MRRRPCEWCGYYGRDTHDTIACRVRMKKSITLLRQAIKSYQSWNQQLQAVALSAARARGHDRHRGDENERKRSR